MAGADVVDAQVIRRVDEVTGALERLAEVLAEEDELPAMLDRFCQQAMYAIPGADMVSVSLLREGHPETASVTDEQARVIDEAQYAAEEGPCLEAASTGEVLRLSVSEVRDRWPAFADTAGEAAVASYLSAPLYIDCEYHGSLNLYGCAAHGFGQLDAALLELFTAAAEAALRTARRYVRAREHGEHLREALVSRAVIDQTKGILMVVRRISADEAFALLVALSQQHNVKVRDIAQRFIADISKP